MSPEQRGARALLAVGLAAGLACAALAAWLVPMSVRASQVRPSPAAAAERRAGASAPSDGFPDVDWDRWHAVNPDILGWVTVPGTSIDHPVVRAPDDDPDFYLAHDVYRKRSVYGCPYLSAECAQGLMGPGAVVLGHHISRGVDPVFATLASYLDPAFANGHSTVLLQTPGAKRALHVDCALAVDGATEQTRAASSTRDELLQWRRDLIGRATVRLEHANEEADQGFCVLVTCSYTRFGNERTLVVAS